ncbi:MAG TPA: hypothetical protein VJ801_15845 [Polyangia bacterium]|jgi:hypothetical protein|nr:hypothetical protein [Polyangia bacterium]
MIAAKASKRREQRARDTARFAEAFFALTGFRPVSAYKEFLPPDLLARPIPSPGELVARFGDRLHTRTSNALRQQDPGPDHRKSWTHGSLLELRGFGLFCLLDVMQALHESGFAPDPVPPSLPATARSEP